MKQSLPEMWRQSPPWFALLVVVGLFVAYIDRQEQRVIDRMKRTETLSISNIAAFEKLQSESTMAIKELNVILRDQTTHFDRLTRLIERND